MLARAAKATGLRAVACTFTNNGSVYGGGGGGLGQGGIGQPLRRQGATKYHAFEDATAAAQVSGRTLRGSVVWRNKLAI